MISCPTCGGAMAGDVCRACLAEGLFGGEDGFEMPAALGGFLPRRRIGRGASGEVWLAFQPGPDREVALKVFLDPQLGGMADRSRFLAEAQALGRLDHPNIVPVLATGEEGGFLFIASRWMTGGTLAELPSRGVGRDAWRESAAVVEKIARAAGHAHRHGLVHRDIKPANILLDGRGEPFLADFGIAVASGMEESGAATGTPGYMAPEQAAGGTVTTAADLYSLGAVLSDLLTGRPHRVAQDQGEAGWSGIDRDLAAICRRCLERDPAMRYRSADDLAEDLARWQRGEPVQARPVGAWTRVGKWAKRRPGAALLTSAVVLTAAILALTLAWGSLALRKERNQAVAQEILARKHAGRAAAVAEDSRLQAYAADVFMASRAIGDGHLGMARDLLARQERAGDMRGVEWHVYAALCRSEDWKHFEDHVATVSAVACAGDGSMVASAGIDGRVVVRTVPEGRILLSLPEKDAPVGALEIPLMTALAASNPDIRADLLTGAITLDEVRMRGRPSKLGELTALAWSPDRRFLASGGDGGFIRVWSVPDGDLRMIFPCKMVSKLAYLADGRLACLHRSESRHRLLLLDPATQECVWKVEDVEPSFAIRENRLAWISRGGGRLHVTDENGNEAIDRGAGVGALECLEFSPDGRMLLALSEQGGRVTRWDLEGGGRESFPAAHGPHRCLMPLGDGVVMAGGGQTVVVGDLDGARNLLRGHGDEITGIAVCALSRLIFSTSKDRTVRWWKWPADEAAGAGGSALGEVMEIRGDGRAWLRKAVSGAVELCRAGGVAVVLGDGDGREVVGFTACGREAVTRRMDGDVVMEWWSVEGAELLRDQRVPWDPKKPLIFGKGRHHFVIADSRGEIRVHRLADGAEVWRAPAVDMAMHRLAINDRGDRIAVGIWPRVVRVLGQGEPAGPAVKVTSGVMGDMVFSPDGRWLAVGSDTNRVLICEASTGEVRHELVGHRQRPLKLDFSPDGRTLVSSSLDGDIRLWHAPTWRPLGVVVGESLTECVRVGEDGRTLMYAVPGRDPVITGRGEP